MTTREKIIAAAREAGFDDRQWESMTYDSGPYEVTTPKIALERFYTTAFDAGQKSLRQQLADREAQIVMLRDRLKDALWDETWWRVEAEKALAATEPKEQWK